MCSSLIGEDFIISKLKSERIILREMEEKDCQYQPWALVQEEMRGEYWELQIKRH